MHEFGHFDVSSERHSIPDRYADRDIPGTLTTLEWTAPGNARLLAHLYLTRWCDRKALVDIAWPDHEGKSFNVARECAGLFTDLMRAFFTGLLENRTDYSETIREDMERVWIEDGLSQERRDEIEYMRSIGWFLDADQSLSNNTSAVVRAVSGASTAAIEFMRITGFMPDRSQSHSFAPTRADCKMTTEILIARKTA